MTDTPRTQAELLALFADNSTRNISAQDMRDLVVSVPPVVAASRFADNGNFTIAKDAPSPIKYKPADEVDPEGWFTDESAYTGDLGFTVPQGGLMRLPPGWYDAFIYQSWGGDALESGADFSLILAHVDDPGTLDDIFGGAQYSVFGVGQLTSPPPNTGWKNITAYSTIRVPSHDLNDDPVTTWPVAVLAFLNHQTNDQSGSFGQVLIRRIGGA